MPPNVENTRSLTGSGALVSSGCGSVVAAELFVGSAGAALLALLFPHAARNMENTNMILSSTNEDLFNSNPPSEILIICVILVGY
ncbi:hypothetical protein D3C81_1941270 [compost metagenome]